MEEAEDDTPISWKPLGAVVAEIVERIGTARLHQLRGEFGTVGPGSDAGGNTARGDDD